MRRPRWIGLTAALAVAVVGACGNDDPAPSRTPGRTIVNVALRDFSVAPERASAPAGAVTFQPRNSGPSQKHELVVAQTSLAPQSLPTKADGSVDETATDLTVIGEIPELAVGSAGASTFTLEAGKYVLFCNVVEKKGKDTLVHYELGMRAAFTTG